MKSALIAAISLLFLGCFNEKAMIQKFAPKVELDDGPNCAPADQRPAARCFILQSQFICANSFQFRNSGWRDHLFGIAPLVAPQGRTATSADSYGLCVIDIR
jgi:hypothetical protein